MTGDLRLDLSEQCYAYASADIRYCKHGTVLTGSVDSSAYRRRRCGQLDLWCRSGKSLTTVLPRQIQLFVLARSLRYILDPLTVRKTPIVPTGEGILYTTVICKYVTECMERLYFTVENLKRIRFAAGTICTRNEDD